MNELFIIFGLILLNGVFAMAEIALISARKSSLSASAKRGSVSARFPPKIGRGTRQVSIYRSNRNYGYRYCNRYIFGQYDCCAFFILSRFARNSTYLE